MDEIVQEKNDIINNELLLYEKTSMPKHLLKACSESRKLNNYLLEKLSNERNKAHRGSLSSR